MGDHFKCGKNQIFIDPAANSTDADLYITWLSEVAKNHDIHIYLSNADGIEPDSPFTKFMEAAYESDVRKITVHVSKKASDPISWILLKLAESVPMRIRYKLICENGAIPTNYFKSRYFNYAVPKDRQMVKQYVKIWTDPSTDKYRWEFIYEGGANNAGAK